jgi:hypothetical protein
MTLKVPFQSLGVGGGREKSQFLVDPTWTSSDKHLLGGIVFWGGLDANEPNLALMFGYFVASWALELQLAKTNSSAWIQTGPILASLLT